MKIRGKKICETLKQVRRQVARANDIPYEPTECRHQGDCLGTCPKCEQEVRYLEHELALRRSLGKAVTVVGVSMGLAALASCKSQEAQAQVPVRDETDGYVANQIRGIPPVGIVENKNNEAAETNEGASCPEKEPDTLVVPLDTMKHSMIFGDVIEQQPSFRGGNQALMQFISDNLRYPDSCEGIQGRVVISFVIERDGSITDAKVVRSLDPLFDEEALRIVNLMPKWQPGKMNGEAVRVKYNIPIRFKLEDEQN